MTLTDILARRIVILDGAMGTMIQRYHLTEDDFRGERFAGHGVKLQGDNDLLSLSRPDVVAEIHRAYLEAGADIIETNTFNAQRVSQAEYGTEDAVRDMNLAAARLARREADRMTQETPGKPRFVAGSIGPTGKTASMSPDVENPAYRAVTFDELCAAYEEQITALAEGGVDLLLVETIFDTLNAKAALEAVRRVGLRTGRTLPTMVSVTVSDLAGRTLSGQTLEAFVTSLAHTKPFCIGMNCGLGPEQMLPFLRQVADVAPCYVSAHPNAGLPNAMGEYTQTPDMMASLVSRFAEEHLVNIVGGCCGSTPDHIRAIAQALSGHTEVRQAPTAALPWLAGLEGFHNNGAFINVGERCNVAGSRKFLRLISEQQYDEALAIARGQVRSGAMVLDVNMDDGMLDAEKEMTNFLNLMASDPEIARLPWMIDSSRFNVIEAALKTIQGKAIVNSVSLKEGEDVFLDHARRVKELGAALIVMAFDEEGQATSYDRKISVCERAYKLLTERLDFDPHDIIFDPNVLTVATGMKEHDRYGLDFIEATRWIHHNLPHAKVSGGVSNLSFAFRGNNYLREAMHAVFLYHAIAAGMDMAIVNPATRVMYADIPEELLTALEDVILCRRDDASERLVDIAEKYKTVKTSEQPQQSVSREEMPLDERLTAALKQGDPEHLEEDLAEALAAYPTPAAIIEGPLMKGMGIVGDLFGEGKMFLPQVVKTARTMKQAVDILKPHIMKSAATTTAAKAGRFLMATVKGDVHDIGKNIVSVVLQCNNFEVTDLGVMVPAERIVEVALEEHPDFIALSGLITPSLDEMCHTAAALKAAGISVPLFIGGATTSALHTAVKIAPLYDGPVFHFKDAAQDPVVATKLLSPERDRVIAMLRYEQEQLRQGLKDKRDDLLTEAEALERRPRIDWDSADLHRPTYQGLRQFDDISIHAVRPLINMVHFYHLWGVRPGTPEADALLADAEAMLDRLEQRHSLRAQVSFFPAYGTADGIVVCTATDGAPRGKDAAVNACPCCGLPLTPAHNVVIPTPRQRRPDLEECKALADYVAPEGHGDYIGAFAVTVSASYAEELERLKAAGDDYESLLMQSLGDRLAEAAGEWMHREVRTKLWGYAPDERLSTKELFAAHYRGIRPAAGYPQMPDVRVIFTIRRLLDLPALGITLTENGAMYPQASECGLYLQSPDAHYFFVG